VVNQLMDVLILLDNHVQAT